MGKKITNNLGLKVAALLIACFVWLIIMNAEDPTKSKVYTNIPVTVANESVITNEGKIYQAINGTEEVNVTVTAKRSVLSEIEKNDIFAEADMKNIEYNLVPIMVMIPEFEGRYDSAEAMPRNMEISIEDNESRTLPIMVLQQGSPRDGYFVENIEALPDTVTLSGPKSQVDRITDAVVSVNVGDMSESSEWDEELKFYDSTGLEVSQDRLTTDFSGSVHVKISVSKAKTVPISIECFGTPADGYVLDEVRLDPESVSIIGKQDILKNVNEIHIADEQLLNIDGAVNDVEVVVDLEDYLPEGVRLADERSGKLMVTAVIEKIGTRTVNYPVGSIVVYNAPEGFKVNYQEISEVDLIFRGPEEALQELKPSNIDVSIDLTGITIPGDYEMELNVKAQNGCILSTPVTVQITLEKE